MGRKNKDKEDVGANQGPDTLASFVKTKQTPGNIMWDKWGSPSIPLGRGDLHITHPELYD